MNVLLNGDLIQVAVVWTVVVALLTKFPDFIYIYMSFADSNIPSD